MKRFIPFLILVLILTLIPPGGSFANTSAVLLGSDVLFDQFHHVIKGKKVGLVTNQTGVSSQGISTIDLLRRDKSVTLAALYTPEHGLDGKTAQANTLPPTSIPSTAFLSTASMVRQESPQSKCSLALIFCWSTCRILEPVPIRTYPLSNTA
ncbi:hypothetical protein BBOR36S_03209 [Brevibacillus borstelensis]